MTCYLAAKRRWITRSKQMLPPHTGPSENNVILEDQLKRRQRQTQTKRKLTHTDLNILHGHAPCLQVRHTHTQTQIHSFYILLQYAATQIQPQTHNGILLAHKTHIAQALFVCAIAERTSHSEELSIKSAQCAPQC